MNDLFPTELFDPLDNLVLLAQFFWSTQNVFGPTIMAATRVKFKDQDEALIFLLGEGVLAIDIYFRNIS